MSSQYKSLPESGGGAVDSVNGETGVVVLDADDVGAASQALDNLVSPVVNVDIDMGGNKLTNLDAPTSADDAATKDYVDSAAGGGVTVVAGVANANIDLAMPGAGPWDGITPSTGDLFLVNAQSDDSEHGIYEYDTDSTPMTRANGWTVASDFTAGRFVFVPAGTRYSGSLYCLSQTITTLGVDSIVFDIKGMDYLKMPISTMRGYGNDTLTIGGSSNRVARAWISRVDTNLVQSASADLVVNSGLRNMSIKSDDGVGDATGNIIVTTGANDDEASGAISLLTGSITNVVTDIASGGIIIATGASAGTHSPAGDVQTGSLSIGTGAAENGFSGTIDIVSGESDYQSGDVTMRTGHGTLVDDGYSGSVLIGTGNTTGTAECGDVRLLPGTNGDTPANNGKIKAESSLQFFNAAADPTNVEAGDVYYNTGSNSLKFYNGSTWGALGGASFPLLAPNGSAGAPSYSFSGDSNSGLWNDGGGNIVMTIDGGNITQWITNAFIASNSSVNLGHSSFYWGIGYITDVNAKHFTLERTITGAGTTGDQVINKVSGTVNFAAAASAVTVTNSLVNASSIIYAVVRTNDGTAQIKNVVPTSGAFTINLSAAATAETSVGFVVTN